MIVRWRANAILLAGAHVLICTASAAREPISQPTYFPGTFALPQLCKSVSAIRKLDELKTQGARFLDEWRKIEREECEAAQTNTHFAKTDEVEEYIQIAVLGRASGKPAPVGRFWIRRRDYLKFL